MQYALTAEKAKANTLEAFEQQKTAWAGEANPKRGKEYMAYAVEFSKRYPIGSRLSVPEFDKFIVEVMEVEPPASEYKGSDGWLAFLQRRHQAKYNLNKASTSPSILDDHGVRPYAVDQTGGQKLEVRAPFQSLVSSVGDGKVDSLVRTKVRKLKYLMQSVDYQELPPAYQNRVENLTDAIDSFKEDIEHHVNKLDRKFNTLVSDINFMIESNVIVPKNGGLIALTSQEVENSDTED